ncbi:uromodulin-like [Lissotriton helveticus]
MCRTHQEFTSSALTRGVQSTPYDHQQCSYSAEHTRRPPAVLLQVLCRTQLEITSSALTEVCRTQQAITSTALTGGVPQCDPACADNELCTYSAGYADCKCQKNKYLNASRDDIFPTVQCEGSAMTLSLNKCLLERFNYSFTQMHFVDTNCTVTSSLQLGGNERVIQVNVTPRAGRCGNEMVVRNDRTVTYSNVLYIPPDDTSGIIISSSLRFNFSCTYNRTMQTSLLTALHPTMDNITGPSEDGSGSITATMAAFKSNSFNDPVLENDTLRVGTPVYIGISTTFPDGETFTLRAERCVAAPSINLGDPGVELISGGCAMTQTMNVQVVENGQSLQVMFEIETFIFNGQPDVYMWCDVSLCLKDPSTTCQCSSGSASTGP